jgi:hypothetical protein
MPFSFTLWLRAAEPHGRAVVFHRSRAWTDSGSRGYELVIEEDRLAFSLVHFWPGNAIKVRTVARLATGVWTPVAVTYDGSSRASGIRLFLDGRRVATEVVRDHLFKGILHRQAWGDADVGAVELTLAGRFRDAGFRSGTIDEFAVYDRCLTAAEVRAVGGGVGAGEGAGELFEYYLARHDAPYAEAMAALRQLRGEENDLVNDIPEIMVMREMPERRATFVLRRGAYDAPGERVEPGTPEAILPFPADQPRNRLGLARWVVDRSNPLTARVVVNRVWRTHFGRGLVGTAGDFGGQGELPVQAELLEWLAGWFMDNGWNLKALHRLIVTSATYRQSSATPPELAVRDPDNRLLARGPRHRLEAEQIRDGALAVSGLLNRSLGGPSVKPYQPAGLWEESGTGKTYVQDKGEKLYRRSLYTFWRRTAPPPAMLTFDATSREVCTARRETTTTPLQALVLLNDPQFVEAARVWAERLVREAGSDLEGRFVRAFRLGTGRAPGRQELAVLADLYREQLARFAREPDAAGHLLGVGERPADRSLPADQVAAMTVVASAVMNLDEFVMKR